MLFIIARRLLQAFVVLLLVALVAFTIFRFIGDPVESLLGHEATVADRQALIDARQRWASALSTGRPRWSRWQREAPDGEATPATHRTADKACF